MAAASLVVVLDIFTEALSILGVDEPGEPIAAADSQSLLFTLNGIVDGWGAEPLTIFSHNIYSAFSTTAGKQSYTVGPVSPTSVWPTPDFVITPLPAEITALGFIIPNALEVPIEIVTADAWVAIGLKSLSSSYIESCWIDYGAPTYTLNLWPLPAAASALVLYADQAVPRFSAISNSVLLPAGYQEALTWELILKSANKFGKEIPQWIPAAWTSAKARIKEANFEAIDVVCDPALTSTGRRSGGGSIRFYEGK